MHLVILTETWMITGNRFRYNFVSSFRYNIPVCIYVYSIFVYIYILCIYRYVYMVGTVLPFHVVQCIIYIYLYNIQSLFWRVEFHPHGGWDFIPTIMK